MKEKLYTIPLNDAMMANDECPFCFIEKKSEEDMLDFVLGSGSTYMESDVREMTDKEGFCRHHLKKMFDYGNTLGNAWILKTLYEQRRKELAEQFHNYKPSKPSFKDRFRRTPGESNSIHNWTSEKDESCYMCKRSQATYERYLDTFFVMYKKDAEFREKVKNSKGFCLHHFGDLCEMADQKLSEAEKAEFYTVAETLMTENMKRVNDDISWLIEKFDYRNKDADWKDSKDAVQRGMQKLAGSYPSAPAYIQKK